MLIGGPVSFGTDIINRFNADSFSRRSGYNIDQEPIRITLAKKSIEYDTVILHSYTRRNSQFDMLKEMVDYWIKNDHEGHIIVTGSIASYYINHQQKNIDQWEYTSQKLALNNFCKMISKRCIIGELKFKLTIINPGMLDTENSRNKPHFTKGINGELFCDVIEFILSLPKDVIIPEIPLESIYDNN